MFRVTGLAEILKSGVGGGGGLTTVKLTTTLWDRLPLVPVTLTAKVRVGVPKVVMKVSVAVPVPPELSATVFGLTPHEGQLGQRGGGEVKRLTVPANPLMLASTIVDVAVDPCCTFWELGFAVMVKFGGTGPPNDAVWTNSESRFGFTTVTHMFGTLVPEQPAWNTISVPLFDDSTL